MSRFILIVCSAINLDSKNRFGERYTRTLHPSLFAKATNRTTHCHTWKEQRWCSVYRYCGTYLPTYLVSLQASKKQPLSGHLRAVPPSPRTPDVRKSVAPGTLAAAFQTVKMVNSPSRTSSSSLPPSSTALSRLQNIANHMSSVSITNFPAEAVPQAPEDPLFGLMRAYKADQSPDKVDLVSWSCLPPLRSIILHVCMYVRLC